MRMKPEELVSKELSVWKERPAKAVSAAGPGAGLRGAGLTAGRVLLGRRLSASVRLSRRR